MKQSHACPKCQGRKLWRIEQAAAENKKRLRGAPLRVAVGRKTLPTKEPSAIFGFDGSSWYSTGELDAYVCHDCGYTEFWSRDFEDLVHNPEDGVHFLDSSVENSEYR